MPGVVEQQHINAREAPVNDLQQLFGVEIGQAAVKEQKLAFAAFQLSQGIGSAQRFGGRDTRLQQVAGAACECLDWGWLR